MKLPLYLTPEAADDLDEAHTWYESHLDGLGARFLGEVSRAFERIAETLLIYAAFWQDVRSCKLRKFPYLIYFRIRVDRIEILAVLHGSRDPALWRVRALPATEPHDL